MADAGWEAPPPGVALPEGEVHVWRASLSLPPAELRRLHAFLDDDERSRAARYRFDVHRDRFVAGRGLQRELLGRYLGVAPAAIRYRAASHGKPELDGPAAGSLRFNVSNAEDGLLLAVVRGREIGVDLEPLRPMPDGEAIAERFFSAPENEVFRAIAAGLRDRAFFTCWTRKEAFIKAVGEGLSMPLDRFDVTLVPGEPARLLRTRGDPAEAERWTLRELDPGPGWLAALCVEGAGWSLRLFDHPGAPFPPRPAPE
ncbi:MAG TPA: 4'-phosphopantetheinyl transferase superfamily protein [Longimicrobium sp.]|nr:4'-phosphopantetheinyl transferase superfamily protein [Longimicrobium sp.]